MKATAPDQNYGRLKYLVTTGYSSDRQETFVRFDVAGPDGPVVSATFRGHSYDSVDGPAARSPSK